MKKNTVVEIKATAAENKQDMGVNNKEASRLVWEKRKVERVKVKEQLFKSKNNNSFKKQPIVINKDPAIAKV